MYPTYLRNYPLEVRSTTVYEYENEKGMVLVHTILTYLPTYLPYQEGPYLLYYPII